MRQVAVLGKHPIEEIVIGQVPGHDDGRAECFGVVTLDGFRKKQAFSFIGYLAGEVFQHSGNGDRRFVPAVFLVELFAHFMLKPNSWTSLEQHLGASVHETLEQFGLSSSSARPCTLLVARHGLQLGQTSPSRDAYADTKRNGGSDRFATLIRYRNRGSRGLSRLLDPGYDAARDFDKAASVLVAFSA